MDATARRAANLSIIDANVRAALEARAADYARAIGVMHRTGRQVAPCSARFEVLLTPTMCRPPHPLGVVDMMTSDPAAYGKAVMAPMSMPLGRSRAGLPLGVQFVGGFGDEAMLFRLAAQIEAAQPWDGRCPAA